LKGEAWKPALASIVPDEKTRSAFHLKSPQAGMERARIVWESNGEELWAGNTFISQQNVVTQSWMEAEAVLPTGWLVFAQTNRPNSTASVAARPR
jgi:hypothetical protein